MGLISLVANNSFVDQCNNSLCVWRGVVQDNPGSPTTSSVDQIGLELRELPASVFQVLRLKVCATMACCNANF